MTRFVILALLAFIGSAHAQPALVGPCMNNVSAGCSLTAPVIAGGAYTGGAINNTPIGNLTPSTGSFSTLRATGAASLLGGGTHTGTFTGGTFSGITLGGSITGTGATITGGTFSGITLSGTIAGSPSYSGTPVWQTSGTIGTSAGTTSLLRMVTAAGSNRDFQWFSGTTAASGLRWRNRVDGAEGGANAGANMRWTALDDAGSSLGDALTFTRADLHATFGGYVQAPTYYASDNFVYSTSISTTTGRPIYLQANYSGTLTAGTPSLNHIQILTDSIDASALGGATVDGFRVAHNFGGGRGPRTAIYGALDLTSIEATPGSHQAGFFTAEGHVNDGGSTGGNWAGSLWAINTITILDAAATFYDFFIGYEVDMAAVSGSSMHARVGMSVNSSSSTDAVQGTDLDTAFTISRHAKDNAYAGWRGGYSIGEPGAPWPMDATNGTLYGVLPQTVYQTTPAAAPRLTAAKRGVDLFPVAFSGKAFRAQGMYVDGSGSLAIGNAKLTANAAGGIAFDVPLQITTAAAVSSGGTSGTVNVGDQLWDDATGLVLAVASVNGSNQATGVSITAPGISSSPPSNPVVLTGSRAANVSVNLTWGSGGNIQIGASTNTIVGTGSALATNATSGFPLLPTTTGAPTGTVGAAGQSAYIVRTDNHKICHSEGGGTWYYFDGTACS